MSQTLQPRRNLRAPPPCPLPFRGRSSAGRLGGDISCCNWDTRGSETRLVSQKVTGGRTGHSYLISQSNHDTVPVCRVWHAGVPQSEIADDNVPRCTCRLNRRADPHARLFRGLGDGWKRLPQTPIYLNLAGVLCDHLLTPGRMRVRAEPELGGTILDAELTQRDVGDEVVWIFRMDESAILMRWLAHSWRVRERCIGREPVPDWLATKVSSNQGR